MPERVVLSGDSYASLCAEASLAEDLAARIAELGLATDKMSEMIADLLTEAARYFTVAIPE